MDSRRVFFLLGFFFVYSLVQLFNLLCFALDRILYPDFANRKLQAPVFIIGPPRSGTTFIHRLLSKDEANFFCFRTWELIFPAIVQKRMIARLGRIDSRLGSPLHRAIERFEAGRFQEFGKMHKISLFSPEEDDKLLIHIFSFHGLVWLFPYPDELRWLNYFDQLGPDQERDRIMRFYRMCIQRQARYLDTRSHLLSKNPFSCHKIASLLHHFPGCKFIYMIRNPLDVIPSMISLANGITRNTLKMPGGNQLEQEAYQTALSFYRYPLKLLEEQDPACYTIVNYEDLVRNPSLVVQNIYQHFGLPLSDAFRQLLVEEDLSMKRYQSRHTYSLQQLSIGPQRIREDLGEIFLRFGFDQRKGT